MLPALRRVVAASGHGLLAALAALGLLATGCGQVDGGAAGDEAPVPVTVLPSPSSAAGGGPTAPAPPATPAGPGELVDLGVATRYVALGDSFSAGAGLAPYDDAGCGRSPRAYPRLVRFTGPADVEVFACEAARVADVAAQAGAARWGQDVGLVTLTVGGNDVGFVDFFAACGLRLACFDQPYGGFSTLAAWSDARREALGPALSALLVDLRARAPQARVALLGYPQLLPAQLGPGPGCQVLDRAFDAGERAALRDATEALNATLAGAAAAAGAVFVPVADEFAGQEACGAGEPWLRFGGLRDLVEAPEGVLHPSDAGQAAYAQALATALG